LYSLILPDLNIKAKNINIVHGEIVSGFLDKSMLGRDAVGLIKQIFNSYGADHTKDFFNNTENLVTRWMMNNSFSISFGDCIFSEQKREEIKNVIRTHISEAYELIKKAHNGIYKPDLDDKYKLGQLEVDMKTILGNVDNKVKDYINKNVDKSNNLYIMSTKVGSAGSELNIRQICASIGPQLIWDHWSITSMNGNCLMGPAADPYLYKADQQADYSAHPFYKAKLFGHNLVEQLL